MILLDTTILIYAVGSEHPLREPSRAVIRGLGARTLRATTTVEVIQEFIHLRARRRDRRDAAELGRRFATLLSPLTTIEPDDLDAGLTLFERYDRLGAFDSVLAATCLRRPHLTSVASADSAFATVADLTHHDPASPDFLAALGLV